MPLFVLEIGSEELPARFLPVEEAELHKRFLAAFEEIGIVHGAVCVMTTPRRAVVIVEDMQAVQSEKEEVISGPPVRVAYDADAKPTKALEGFVRTNGVQLEDVFTLETDKGAYIAVRKRTGGAQAVKLLEEICPAIITAQPFAKKMRWGAHSLAYARPLRWILALFDETVVPFTVGHVASGRVSFGHRIHGQNAEGCIEISVPTACEYLPLVREKGGVEPDAALRRACIVEKGNALAAAFGGSVLWKESLLDEVQGLCEHPVPLIGTIDPSFLEVPRQVLLTSMESHQKSFGVESSDGALLPYFLTVSNMCPVDMDVVQKGWERVLRARLEDARFFWRTDLEDTLDAWLARLDNVIFLGPLGSVGEKTRRLERLCSWLATQCDAVDVSEAARAGRLSKADLVSGMVGEFASLQGIMGGIYARHKGETEAVALAVSEQYLPAGPETPVPTSRLGALLSLADKADTLVGCFGLNIVPTGTADPNGLRRCALGITRIILEFGLRIDVKELFAKAHEFYGEKPWKLDKDICLQKLEEFFAGRVKNYWQGQQHDVLLVEAVLNADCRDVWAAGRRLAALQHLHAGTRYVEAVQTFKRVANIIIKQQQGQENALTGQYMTALLQEDAEKTLANALDLVLPRFDALWQSDNFEEIPALLLELRPHVDALFETVMVMCDDKALRTNRLNMLKALMDRMGKFADFAALQV